MSGLSDLLQRLNTEGWSSRRIEKETERHGRKVSYATVSRYLAGTHPRNPDGETLEALALAFGADVNDLRAALGRPGVGEPFDLGPESARLTGPQREAVRHVVRVMLEQNDAMARDAQRDGSTINTAHIPVPEDYWALAASEGERVMDELDRAAGELGEESQDPGTDEPA